MSQVPLVIGRYELHPVIATGGMASIHLGRLHGSSGFVRTVAIKRLHPQYARDPVFVAMFLDEARLVARIRHPNVVPIVDVVSEDEELFLVMEYIHGESLARLVLNAERKGVRIPPPLAVAIFVDVLHGLHAAHEAKTAEGVPLSIVHRDVTPHNVLVGVDGSARIADFGIAKATLRAHSTNGGMLKGKLCYMAPEQLHGRAVGRTTDVYSAAVSLWEALTGRMLFGGQNEAHVMEKILTGVTRPPSAFAADVPPALDEIVMRGLEMKPHKRFSSTREMALALEKSATLPSASEIGTWVHAFADQAIAERVAMIESLERAPPVEIAIPVALTTTSATPDAKAADSAGWPALARRARLTAALTLVAILAVLGGALLAHLRIARQREAARSFQPPPPISASDAPPPAASEALSNLLPSPPASSEVEPPKSARPKKNSHTSLHTTTPKPDDPCKMPYTRDETGRKIYKRECL